MKDRNTAARDALADIIDRAIPADGTVRTSQTIAASIMPHAAATSSDPLDAIPGDPAPAQDGRICRVCDGGPGNAGVCLCGERAYDTPAPAPDETKTNLGPTGEQALQNAVVLLDDIRRHVLAAAPHLSADLTTDFLVSELLTDYATKSRLMREATARIGRAYRALEAITAANPSLDIVQMAVNAAARFKQECARSANLADHLQTTGLDLDAMTVQAHKAEAALGRYAGLLNGAKAALGDAQLDIDAIPDAIAALRADRDRLATEPALVAQLRRVLSEIVDALPSEFVTDPTNPLAAVKATVAALNAADDEGEKMDEKVQDLEDELATLRVAAGERAAEIAVMKAQAGALRAADRRAELAAMVLAGICACVRDFTGARDTEGRVALALDHADAILAATKGSKS